MMECEIDQAGKYLWLCVRRETSERKFEGIADSRRFFSSGATGENCDRQLPQCSLSALWVFLARGGLWCHDISWKLERMSIERAIRKMPRVGRDLAVNKTFDCRPRRTWIIFQPQQACDTHEKCSEHFVSIVWLCLSEKVPLEFVTDYLRFFRYQSRQRSNQ